MSNLLTPGSTNPQQNLYARVAALERRAAALERAPFRAAVKPGAPVPAEGTEGAIAADSANGRIWIKVGGSWRYAAVTPWP